ncbi:unnamed protein product [Closterium sp. Naga37s-1]|nr:unnamed protein product [Closterium sp. Naga37s-1]
MRHADGGVQGIGPCDEESRAVGALPDEANEEANAGGWYGELAIGGEREDERANDDDGIGGHETGYETRRDKEIAANDAGAEIVTIAAQADASGATGTLAAGRAGGERTGSRTALRDALPTMAAISRHWSAGRMSLAQQAVDVADGEQRDADDGLAEEDLRMCINNRDGGL